MKVSVNFPRCVIHWSQVIPVESIARSVVTYLWRFFFNWPKTTKTQFTLSLLSMAAKQLTDQCWFCVGLLCNLPKIIHPRSNNEEVYLQHKVCWKILLSSSDCSILKSSLSTYLVVVWISHKRVCLSAHQFLWMRRSIFQASFVMLFCVVLCCKLFYSPLLCGLDIFSILVAVVSLIKMHYRTILQALQLWILSWPMANLSDRFQFMVFCHVCFEPRLLIRPVWTRCGFANVCTDGPSRKNFLLQSGDEHCQFFLF